MRIKEISVTGLFGTYNHTIPLAYDDHVTIVHGPNGVGKTMMLKMIASLVEGRLAVFERVPFLEFKARLDDGSEVLVKRRHDEFTSDEGRTSKVEIVIRDGPNSAASSVNVNSPTEIPKHVLDTMDQEVPSPFSRSGNGWLNRSTGQKYSVDQIIDKFPTAAEFLPKKYRTVPLKVFAGLEVFFVETKRLEAENSIRRNEIRDDFFFNEDSSNGNIQLRVEQYSRDIVQRIKAAVGDYAKNSQESDRTFPERLVRFVRQGNESLPEKVILELMVELEEKRKRLISLGFLDSETGLEGLNESDVKKVGEALTIYIKDVQLKLSVFDDLADRVGQLIDIVNHRFKNKTLKLHRETGFSLESSIGEEVNLEDLSSGEQHELVLLYELLFRAPKNGLVLVDEPEISLHVAWQSRFLEDLMGILKLTKSYSIVATHSPVIIGPRWDITTELSSVDSLPDTEAIKSKE